MKASVCNSGIAISYVRRPSSFFLASYEIWPISRRRSADDLVGRVVVSLKELMKLPNQLHDREDHLSGFEDADDMPGTVTWSVGYYDKVHSV